MLQYQFIVLVCAGLMAILGAVKIVTEAILKKESAEIKKPCGDRFTDHSGKIKIVEKDVQESKDRIFAIELDYKHILTEINTIKGDIKEMKIATDKNGEMTRQIYTWMSDRKRGGKRK